jgi:biotin operon repressor
MAFDAITTLRDAGVQVDALNEKQREIVAGLSENEVATLTKLHRRMEEAGGDVEGHMVVGAGIF